MSEIVVGRIPALEALRAGRRRPLRVSLLKGARGLEELEAAAKGIEISHLPRRELDRLSGGVTHQGVVLEAEPLPLRRLDVWLEKAGKNATAVVLDGIEDPQNFGAIVRSAAGFGAGAVVFGKDRAAPISPAMVKAAAGAAEYVDLVRVTNIARALAEIRDADFWVTGLAGEAEQTVWDIDWRGRAALVIGSEGKGLRRLVRESCDTLAGIPMQGPVSSFNASVSAAICLAEICRQRRE